MMKNVMLKKFLKGTIFKTASAVNKLLPKNENIILLYSANKGLMFNLPYVKDYLLDNDFNERYKIICGVESLDYVDKNEKGVSYVKQINAFLIFLRAKYIFYTAGQIPIKPSKKQKAVLITHGACSLKAPAGLSKINNGDEKFFNHIVYPSDYYDEVVQKAFKCQKSEIIYACEPMTDVFFEKSELYDLGDYDKILLWTPTFRQSEYLGYNDSSENKPLLIFDENDYEMLDKLMKKMNCKLIVKLHPMQNKIENRRNFENLSILNHDEFVSNGFNLYNLMKQVDVLIGDYSSTSMQFLLLNKPIAFVIPDIDEYKNKRGFIFENIEDYMPGYIIKSKREFIDFIEQINNNDIFVSKREEIKNLLFKEQNGNSCSIIFDQIGLR